MQLTFREKCRAHGNKDNKKGILIHDQALYNIESLQNTLFLDPLSQGFQELLCVQYFAS